MQRPVCGYVQPLRLGRVLASPREAAHWVSLLASKDDQVREPRRGEGQIVDIYCITDTDMRAVLRAWVGMRAYVSYVSVCVCDCVSVCVCVCDSVTVCVYMCLYMCECVFMCVCTHMRCGPVTRRRSCCLLPR